MTTAAEQLPLWVQNSPSEPIPAIVGKSPSTSTYIAKPGESLACYVKPTDKYYLNQGRMSPSKVIANESNADEHVWFLGEVISYDSTTDKYMVNDIDVETDERWNIDKNRTVPLPHYKIDPRLTSKALFELDSRVLALYPQTTCFYKARIYDQPKTLNDPYMITFDDPSYESKMSPPMPVHQRYVISYPFSD